MDKRTHTSLSGKHSSFSEVIDIRRLERENRNTLVAGFVVAVLVIIALEPLVAGKYRNFATAPVLKGFRIPVTLVTLPAKKPKKPRPETPASPEIQTEKEPATRSPESFAAQEDSDTAEQVAVAESDTEEVLPPEERKKNKPAFSAPSGKKTAIPCRDTSGQRCEDRLSAYPLSGTGQ